MIPRATVRDLSYLGLTVAVELVYVLLVLPLFQDAWSTGEAVEGGIPAGLAALVVAGIRQAA